MNDERIAEKLIALEEALLNASKKYKDVILPGYTHMQRAQPVLFAHHMLAYFAMLERDFKRLEEALALADCTLQDVAKVNVWLDDPRDFGSFNRVYMECFGEHRPARSTVESRLMIDAKVEIDVTAYKPL